MKVLLVCEDLPALQVGGLGRHVVRLGNALIDQGHGVTLMGRSDIDYQACAEEVGFAGPFIGGFTLRRDGWKELPLGVFMPYKRPHLAKRIATAIVARAGEFDVVHYHGHLPLIGRYVPESVSFIQTRHDQGSECVTHSRFRRGQICDETDPRACAGCATSQPNILQRSASAFAVRQYRRQTAEAFSRHPTIFVSDFLRTRFAAVVPSARPGTRLVIHNFIDANTLPASAPRGHASIHKRVVIVSRIDEPKGVGAFLDVLARRGAPSLEVEIVGDGPQRKALEAAFASSTIRFAGWCLPSEALERVSRADAMVVPSIWEEPFGQTTLEGIALGKPVFALALGGTSELKRYERWDGQLSLFDSMAALVDALIGGTISHPEPERRFEADVAAVLPQLLHAYRNVASDRLSRNDVGAS